MKKSLTTGLLGILVLVISVDIVSVAFANPITESTVVMNDQCPGNPNKDNC